MPWTCPTCERVLKIPNQWHCCIKQDFEALFEGKNPELMYIFEKILGEVFDWEGIHVSATYNCIVFVSTQTFLVIKPMQKVLNVKFYLKDRTDEPPIFKVSTYGKHYEHHVRLSHLEEVDGRLIGLIRASYNMFQKK